MDSIFSHHHSTLGGGGGAGKWREAGKWKGGEFKKVVEGVGGRNDVRKRKRRKKYAQGFTQGFEFKIMEPRASN